MEVKNIVGVRVCMVGIVSGLKEEVVGAGSGMFMGVCEVCDVFGDGKVG